MYSFTLTNIHSIVPIQATQPRLLVKCKCSRALYQQQIYTCLICPSYSCHYCTQIDFVELQCRSCKKQFDINNKLNRCQYCFSCVQCSNVLTLSKDPQTKNYIMSCQFCYWTTKDIKLVQEKIQVLLEKLIKYSAVMKDNQIKLYNHAYTYFKENNLAIQLGIEQQLFLGNQASKFYENSKKPMKNFIQESNLSNKQNEKMQKNLDGLIKRTSLQQPSQQYRADLKYPQGLPLIARKTRKCADCKKPLTVYRGRGDEKTKVGSGNDKTIRGQQKIQLWHKQIRTLMCQYTPLTSNFAKIKLLKDAVINGQQHKKDQVVQIQANKQFEVTIKIQNRMRNTVAQVTYIYIVEGILYKNK